MCPSKCESDICGNYVCQCNICKSEYSSTDSEPLIFNCEIDIDDKENEKENEKAVKYQLMRLKTENEKFRKALICMVCKERQVQTLLFPCTHVVMCETCADEAKDCILCNERIRGTVRIYMA